MLLAHVNSICEFYVCKFAVSSGSDQMKELANGIHSFSVYRAYRVGETQLDYRLVPLDLKESITHGAASLLQ